MTTSSLDIVDTKDIPWVQDLGCMTLIDTQLQSAEDIFLDAQGNPLPPPAKGLGHHSRIRGWVSCPSRL